MSIFKRIWLKGKRIAASKFGSAAYWSVYAVVENTFHTKEESLNYFFWRSDQYANYINLMPVNGLDNKVVLDYGCGPGNDLVGFIEFSKIKRLIAADVSERSLDMARKRVQLHDSRVHFIKLDENDTIIPLDSGSVDYVHSSGVLHHVRDLKPTLAELHRVLKPGGQLRVMVYNYDSIWLHLNSAYLERVKLKNFRDGESLFDIFRTTTDGKECPISRVYKPAEFVKCVESSGFDGKYLGAAISMHELKIINSRFDAILDIRLAKEHRDFLLELEFDEKNLPVYRGNLAGIDACFLFTKK